MTDTHGHGNRAPTRALGGVVAILLFVLGLAAFVIQSSLTQYVQRTLGFRQPFFLFFAGHSSFMIIFPIHLLYLGVTSRKLFKCYISTLRTAVANRLSSAGHDRPEKAPFPTTRLVVLVFALAAGINIPGLLWYAAVSLASIGDITALWNTNSFWVYVLTVKLYHLKWEPRKLGAVVLACLGVMLDVYGGSKSLELSEGVTVAASPKEGPPAPLVGDLMTLVASISFALYEVLYKRYAALPNDSEADDNHDGASFSYESLSDASTSTPSLTPGGLASSDGDQTTELPFGLYPNFLTSCMGICTFFSLVIGFPVLHWLSIEPFTFPDAFTFWCIAAMASAGVIFNSCFMILLGLWGPVLTSVGNLLTIVLVLITDFLFSGSAITAWSLLGSGMIVAAFGVLVVDIIRPAK